MFVLKKENIATDNANRNRPDILPFLIMPSAPRVWVGISDMAELKYKKAIKSKTKEPNKTKLKYLFDTIFNTLNCSKYLYFL